MNYTKIRNYVGIIGPVYYFILLTSLGLLWEGYDPVSQSMSVLGAVDSPYRYIMNFLGFSLVGVMIIIFAYNYHHYFGNNRLESLIFVFLVIAGSFMFLVGFFPCDSMCVDVTTIGYLHSYISVVPAIFLPLSAMMTSKVLENRQYWGNSISVSSFLLGLVSLASGPMIFIVEDNGYGGFIQRIGIGLSLLWMVIMSVKFEQFRRQKLREI